MSIKERQNLEKEVAGIASAELVRDGMIIGLGTGSTVSYFLKALGKKLKKGMKIRGVPTSESTAVLCRNLGIELLDFSSVRRLDLAIDGADEIDHNFQMIKGGGGALLREKIVASAADHVVIIIDSSKHVACLGAFPLPIEITQFGYQQVTRKLQDIGIAHTMRLVEGRPYITDNGNFIFDCAIQKIPLPETLHAQLKAITGVIETGLFINLCHTLIVGNGNQATIFSK